MKTTSAQQQPLKITADTLQRFANEPFVLDIYCWLAALLPELGQPTLFSWPQLHRFYGVAYAELRHFKMRFGKALDSALQAYPLAEVHVDSAKGVFLRPSPAPTTQTLA